MSPSREVFVCGVGCTPFAPAESKAWNYPDMVREAGTEALRDAGVEYAAVEAVVASYCYGEPTSGQRAVYELGLTGVPVFNVNNNCSSGSSALMLGRHLVQSGAFHSVLVIGFEKMERGLSAKYDKHTSPVDRHFERIPALGAPKDILPGMNQMTSEVIRMFALAAREYQARWPGGLTDEDAAAVAVKNRRHGQHNPNACFYKVPPPPLETVKSKRMLCAPITVYQSALTADGAAAALLCSPAFRHHSLPPQAKARCVPILGQAMASDLPSSFDKGFIQLSGYDMSKAAAQKAFREAGLGAEDVDVVELHDCFAPNELLMYEALGLAPEGGAGPLFRSGRWERTGGGGEVYRMGGWVVNPSGGLESKGHPIGATGVAQAHDLVTQLRGEAGIRQVPGKPRAGLQHNFGIGGAAVCTVYGRPSPRPKL